MTRRGGGEGKRDASSVGNRRLLGMRLRNGLELQRMLLT